MRKSAKGACFFQNKLLSEVEKIIDEEIKVFLKITIKKNI